MVNVYFHSVGFGFDSVSNDFKAVRLLNVQSRSASNLLHISQEAEVYSVSSGSWRQLDPKFWETNEGDGEDQEEVNQ
ncbi:hypothetical protein SO802_009205 [Lithocarpus litseifolius]|uniref:Uncharacterized protein n=1 Tax=Lithocarpus litseifolius TaxID=425828 RepID=A0AAW2DDK6_9ROSI